MSRARVFALTGVLLLAACEELGYPDPDDGEEGVLLAYAGGGRHEAAGAPGFSNGDVVPATFATAFTDSVGGLVIAAFDQKNGTRGDLFILQLGENRTGAFGPCGVGADCHGRVLENIDAANTLDVGAHWELTGGTVSVQALDARLVASVSDLVLDGPGDGPTRTIDEGTIDLPLLTGAEAVAMMRCFLVSATGGSCE